MERQQGAADCGPEAPGSAGSKLIRTLANPWRARILGELYARPMSPSQFVNEMGGEISTISRHFRQLADWGYLEVVDEKSGGRRRGGVEHVYRAMQRNQLDSEAEAQLPRDVREERSRYAITSLFRRFTEAVDAGTFDSLPERHLSWDAVSLDRQAWKEVTDRLDALLASLPQLETEAAQRMKESGEDSIYATIGLAAFPSPTGSKLRALRAEEKSPE
jgi:DNA-binding transcriptional ArsR family regulator